MNNKIFSGLEEFGFKDIDNINLYEVKSNSKGNEQKSMEKEKETEKKLLYEKEVICPVCGFKFKQKAVKTSAYKMIKKDSDFFITYEFINPYLYDVWVCNKCGYSAMKSDFPKIKKSKIDLIKEKITSKWKPKNYPDMYNEDIAIERYKLALLNYYVTESLSSSKAMTCLKIAWMYRIKKDEKNEKLFLKQALLGFEDAYYKESFPIYGMDKFTITYLIGELNRRLLDNHSALSWLGRVITEQGAKSRLKDMARNQRDLIKAQETEKQEQLEKEQNNSIEKPEKKESFFKKFFK